jgi:prephenate dehydrogenase
MKVGLIGRGRLGQLIEDHLGQDVELFIHEAHPDNQNPHNQHALEVVCACPIVIAAVPISALEGVLKTVAPLIATNTLFVDVCSVKTIPMELMKTYLPKDVQILGTHPMFGPDSAATTLFGSKIVFCPERVEPRLLKDLKAYLEKVGLTIIETSAQEHDRQISHSLLVTHFIGRTLMEFKASKLAIDTKGYRRLMKILEVVENDSWQLFEDMIHYNPEAKNTLDEWLVAQKSVLEKARVLS